VYATFNHRQLRQYVGGVAWPTIGLAVATWVVFIGSVTAFALGHIPAWALVFINSISNFYSFTVLHEAVHENIEGSGRGKLLTVVLGWASGLLFLAPFQPFRVIHLTHHQHTNVPVKDPDIWVAGSNPFLILLRCLLIYPHYLYEYMVKFDKPIGHKMKTLLIFLLYWGSATALLFTPLADITLYGLILPAILGTGLTALLFDWLPHHPHKDLTIAGHTRNFPSRTLNIVLAGQNYHQLHHVNPRVPFHRYQAAFKAASVVKQ